MSLSQRSVPPFSPVLLAGLALRPLPPLFLQPALTLAFATMRRRHPSVFERLSEFGEPLFLIDPVDLPLVFLLRPCGRGAGLTAARTADGLTATAAIRGPLLLLIDLLEGRLDGDALFFSRDLTVEGETAAVITLRNAIDSDEIDLLSDFLATLGPLAGPAGLLASGAKTAFSRAAEDLDLLRAALIEPGPRGTANNTAEIAEPETAPATGGGPTQRSRAGVS